MQLFAEPRHPYTQALLSAIPAVTRSPAHAPAPAGRSAQSPSRRRRVPSASALPIARSALRQELPALAAEPDGHATACHLWRDIVSFCAASRRRRAGIFAGACSVYSGRSSAGGELPAEIVAWQRRSADHGKARFRRIAAGLLLASSPVAAQTTLRIGLAEDPDVLDPTLARTYVGRIVFASLCDKLFDIDDKLNIVPQLALSHETSEDGKTVTIKLRPGVKFHDGRTMDADAVKASLERHMTMQGSFRKPELAAVDKVEVADAGHRAAATEEPVLAADRPARRPRRHDPEPEGGRRRPATSSASSPSAPGPSSSSSACSRTASCWRSSPTIGTRPTSTSIASCSGRSWN